MKLKPFCCVAIVAATCFTGNAEQGYEYPLKPGTAAWDAASAIDRYNACVVPKTWREEASSRQLFLSVVTHPYFLTLASDTGSGDKLHAYSARETTAPWRVLIDAESRSDFGSQAPYYLRTLNLSSVESTRCHAFNGVCWRAYMHVCFIAALETA